MAGGWVMRLGKPRGHESSQAPGELGVPKGILETLLLSLMTSPHLPWARDVGSMRPPRSSPLRRRIPAPAPGGSWLQGLKPRG